MHFQQQIRSLYERLSHIHIYIHEEWKEWFHETTLQYGSVTKSNFVL